MFLDGSLTEGFSVDGSERVTSPPPNPPAPQPHRRGRWEVTPFDGPIDDRPIAQRRPVRGVQQPVPPSDLIGGEMDIEADVNALQSVLTHLLQTATSGSNAPFTLRKAMLSPDRPK